MGNHPRPLRRHGWGPAVCALMLALTGCALVPTGGPVLEGRNLQPESTLDDPYVRVLAIGPRQGWTPKQIARGFLAASASFADDHGVARQYLAPGARSGWDPAHRAEVYADGSGFNLRVERSSPGSAEVRVEADHVATITRRGQYTPAPSGSRFQATFRVRTVDGQWRITNPPRRLLLTPRHVQRAYRSLNLYFLEPSFQALVPNSIYLPARRRGRLATELADALVSGPTSWLARAVRSAFPEGTRLIRPVEVTGGTATIRLGGTATTVDRRTIAYMSAQLAWTLTQLPTVEQVRLNIGGRVVRVPGAGRLVSIEDWSSMHPDGTVGAVPGYMVRDGRLLVTGPDGWQPAPGPAGSGSARVRAPAVALGGNRVAWLTPSRKRLRVGALRAGGDSRQVLAGRRLLAPSWDRYGNLWVVEDRRAGPSAPPTADAAAGRPTPGGTARAGQPAREPGGAPQRDSSGTVVWMLAEGAEPVRVRVPGLQPQGDSTQVQVQGLRVARDGTRVALITSRAGGGGADEASSRLLLGRIERKNGDVRIAGLLPLRTGLGQIADLAWRDAGHLTILGDSREAFGSYLVDVATGEVSATGSLTGMVSIAAAPGKPTLAGLDSGQVYRSQENLGWQPLGAGTRPVYPG